MSANMKTPIYLDYNATSPIRPSVIDAVTSAMQSVGNPSSVHGAGRSARSAVEQARAKIAAMVNARPRDVMFCSGGTEASNAALYGAQASSLIISAIEHECVQAAADASDLPVFRAPVAESGVILLNELEDLLCKAPSGALVSVMAANNETGAIQPIAQIAEIARKHGALFHCDAVQAAGRIPLDIGALGTNYLTLSSHKIGGPQGVGAIVLSPTAPLKPLIVGGGQELGRRSGTENVAGIVGFGEAAMEAMAAIPDMARLALLRDRLEGQMRAHAPTAVIIGAAAERLANTSCIAIPGLKGETQVMHFDLAGICISSGSACSSGKVKVSHVLSAMGYSEHIAASSIRVSFGYQTEKSDVDAFFEAWKSLYDRKAAQGGGFG